MGILSLSLQRGQCRTTRKTTEYNSTDSPSLSSVKCNVLRESLSEDSLNIPCATLKRRGSWSWVISLYLWFYVQDVDIRKRIELIQDFDMPALSDRIRVSKDGQYVLATGKAYG